MIRALLTAAALVSQPVIRNKLCATPSAQLVPHE